MRTPEAHPRIALSLFFVAGVGVAATVPAQEGQTPVFGSTVSITRVKVAVLDDDERAVSGLGADDFRVLDDGEEREIRLVLDPEQAPLDLGMVLDYSTSVADTWPDARERVHAFLDALAADDCVYLLPFNSRVGPGVRDSPRDETMRLLVERFPMYGATRLYDAVFAAYSALDDPASAAGTSLAARLPGACGARGRVVQRRPALLVLTDGADDGSGRSYRDVLMQAWRSDVPVFPVAVGTAALSGVDLDGYRNLGAPRSAVRQIETTQRQLAELARVSGGRMVTQREIRDGYAEVLSLLRGYYVIGYRTPEPRRRGWHDVEVRLAEPHGRRVIVQPGYYGEEVDPRPVQGALDAGSEALRGRDFPSALRWFDIAAGFGIDMGTPDLGAGLAHEALGQFRLARDAYDRSLGRYPGLAAAHLYLARVSLRLADLQAAWDHAVRAKAGGEDADELLERLRLRDPDPPDLERLRARPVLFLVPTPEPGLEAQLDLDVLFRGLGRLVDARPELMLTRRAAAASYLLTLRVDHAGDGTFRGDLELWDRQGQRLESEDLRIDDVHASDLADVLATPLQRVLRRLLQD